jgi:hypothetical protein
MNQPRWPRAFISYRHIEDESGSSHINEKHRAWVETFVADLRRWSVDVIFDSDIRMLFQPYTAKDPHLVPALAEFSAISSYICHAFIPILTPAYIDRIGYADYEPQRGTKQSFVLEEWHFAMHLANARVIQYIPVIRAGEPERMATLPIGVGPENAFDMRDPAHYEHQVRFIAERVYEGWDGGKPLLNFNLGEWLGYYIQWCREHYPGCSEKRVDEWQVDFVRTRLFIDDLFKKNAE